MMGIVKAVRVKLLAQAYAKKKAEDIITGQARHLSLHLVKLLYSTQISSRHKWAAEASASLYTIMAARRLKGNKQFKMVDTMELLYNEPWEPYQECWESFASQALGKVAGQHKLPDPISPDRMKALIQELAEQRHPTPEKVLEVVDKVRNKT